MAIRPLLFYMQAADYPDIIDNLNQIPCDKFITKYYPYPWPHTLAREFFLEHEEYTHLIVQPQDLLVTKENYDKLIEKLKEFDYPVLSGVCNVDRPGTRQYGLWAICKKCPSRYKNKRIYTWVPSTNEKIGVMDVEFTGMVFCAIKHNIIERTRIDGDPIFKGCIHRDGKPAPDLNFCLNCKELGISIKADTDNRMIHYANHKPSLVNKLPASILFLRKHEKLTYGSKTEIQGSSQSLQG